MKTLHHYLILLIGLFKTFLKYPLIFLTYTNKENFLKLKNALGKEDLPHILRNIRKYLSAKKDKDTVVIPETTEQDRAIRHFMWLAQKNLKPHQKTILFVTHETTRTGAPLIILQIAKDFQQLYDIQPVFMLLKPGEIHKEFALVFPSYYLQNRESEQVEALELELANLLPQMIKELNIDTSYVNSAESRFILPYLRQYGISNIVSLVHEMGNFYPENAWDIINENSKHMVFPAQYIKEKAFENTALDDSKIHVRGQGLLKPEIFQANRSVCKRLIRQELGIEEDAIIVLSCGSPIARKGIDIFTFTAISILNQYKGKSPLYFIWLGGAPHNYHQMWAERDIQQSGFEHHIRFIGSRVDTIPWFVGSEVFYMTSRGDPFPCVIHEAIAAGLTIVGFENAGGLPEMIPSFNSYVHAYGDIAGVSQSILDLVDTPSLLELKRQDMIDFAQTSLNFQSYSIFLHDLLFNPKPIIPKTIKDINMNGKYQPKPYQKTIYSNKPSLQLKDLQALAPWHMKIPLTANLSTSDGNILDSEQNISVIDLGDMEIYFKKIFPEGLVGKSFLDIGCNAGGYCFIANQLGASFTHGFDVREHWINQAQFVQQHFQIPDEKMRFEVQHLDKFLLSTKKYDVTLFKGVLYHLPFPIKALVDLCHMTNDVIIVDTATRNDISKNCFALAFEGTTPLMSGVDRLAWYPSGPEVIESILKWAGFPYTLVTKNIKSTFNKDKRFVRRKNLGRMRILAAKKEIYIENYKNNQKTKAIATISSPIKKSPLSQKVVAKQSPIVVENKRLLPKISPSKSNGVLASPQVSDTATNLYLSQLNTRNDVLKINLNQSSDIEMPTPPPELMQYKESPERHLISGKETMDNMINYLSQVGYPIESSHKILEFGCSNGRMMRWLAPYTNDKEIWGCDIQADKIIWNMGNLHPNFNFLINTINPHLSFEDHYFDLIFAGSIFTHFNELHLAWLYELIRITCSGGLLYLTFMDEHSIETLKKNPSSYKFIYNKITKHPNQADIWNGTFDFIAIQPNPKIGFINSGLVCMHSSYIKRVTQSRLDLLAIQPKAYSKLQTAYIFRKR